jgi:hypothetical protein
VPNLRLNSIWLQELRLKQQKWRSEVIEKANAFLAETLYIATLNATPQAHQFN